MPAKRSELKIQNRVLSVSNLDKVLYPKVGFTKGDVINFYIKISEYLLPHLKNRPITLKRYPGGVEESYFYEKQCPSHRPDWIQTTDVPKDAGGKICYCMFNDLPSLVWAANLADLELHTFLHKAPKILQPNFVAFDLDPGPPANIIQCADVALLLKDIFDSLKLESFAKTSGSKGMQIYVPLNMATTYEKTKTFAEGLATFLEREHPNAVVSKMQKRLRGGKVFVDWSQNDDHKTTICVYSLRAKETPTVSCPVTWDEVKNIIRKKKPELFTFDTESVLKRVKTHGDLFADVLTLKQKPSLLKIPSS